MPIFEQSSFPAHRKIETDFTCPTTNNSPIILRAYLMSLWNCRGNTQVFMYFMLMKTRHTVKLDILHSHMRTFAGWWYLTSMDHLPLILKVFRVKFHSPTIAWDTTSSFNIG